MKIAALAAFAALTLGTAMPASAGSGRDESAQRSAISREQAIRIARGYGMVEIREIENDDGEWEIEGRDHRGRSLEVVINRQGRVTQVDRDDDDEDDDD